MLAWLLNRLQDFAALCWLRGHDTVTERREPDPVKEPDGQAEVFLRCQACGRRTSGWQVPTRATTRLVYYVRPTHRPDGVTETRLTAAMMDCDIMEIVPIDYDLMRILTFEQRSGRQPIKH